MDLWIRSQLKGSLTKVNDLRIMQLELEVLDEIQKLLTPKMIIKNEGRDCVALDGTIYRTNIVSNINSDIQQLSTYVYEIPKE